MTRRIRLGWMIAVAFLITAPAGGQFPGQNIPPTRVPLQSDEPPLADKGKASELPEKSKQSLIGSAPASGAAAPITPVTPAGPVSLDPPTPVVTIHLVAPSSISAGADVEYKLIVENKSQAEAHHVRASFTLPDGAQFQKADPPVADESTPKMRAWKLGTLRPGEKRTITITVLAQQSGIGELDATARVQFEHGQKVRTVLNRPQIAIRKVSNRHALENEPILCKLIVENTGAVEVNNISIKEALGEGLSFDPKDAAKAMENEWKIPILAPKQTREFTYKVSGKGIGERKSKIVATAERGVSVEQPWSINVGPSPLSVKLTGPEKIYLNYPAQYDIVVKYDGTVPLDNVVVAFTLQKGMKVVRSTPGSKSFENRVQWAIPRLTAKETKFSIWAQASTPGLVPTLAEVLWHGPKQTADTKTEFLGAAALHVDVRESNDPIRVGDKVRYTLTVTNRGTAAAKDVKLVAKYSVTQFALDVDGSDGIAPKGTQGTQEIGPLTISPKGTVTKVITLKAISAGKVNFHVEMESPEHLTGGNVTREESTTITD